MKEIFAVVIYRESDLFWNFAPYLFKQEDGLYKMSEQLTPVNAKQYEFDDTQKRIVKLCHECKAETILKAFSHGESYLKVLIAILKRNPQTAELIPNYINKRRFEVVSLLKEHTDILVFLRKFGEKTYSKDSALRINPDFAYAENHFDLAETGLTYYMDVVCGARKLDLNESYLPLCGEPAVFVLGKTLYLTRSLKEGRISVMINKGNVKVESAKVKTYLDTFVRKLLRTETGICSGFDIEYHTPELFPTLTLCADPFGKSAVKAKLNYGQKSYLLESSEENEVLLTECNGRYKFDIWVRDFAKERELTAILINSGFYNNGDYFYSKNLDWSLSATDVTEAFSIIREYHLHTTEIVEKEDWFDVKIVLSIRGFDIPFYKLRGNILHGNRVYTLPDGYQFNIPEEWFTLYAEMFRTSAGDTDKLKIHKEFVSVLPPKDETPSEHIPVVHKDWKVPETLNANLRPYQHTGYSFLASLYDVGLGGCLADDMGLGKTLQFLTLFLHIYKPEKNQNRVVNSQWRYESTEPTLFDQVFDDTPSEASVPVLERKPASLVVVPTSVLFNWIAELQKFAPSLTYFVYYGVDRRTYAKNIAKRFDDANVVFTTYSILVRDIELLQTYKFECAVLDEGQNIKNSTSQSYQAALKLNAKSRFSITGTPIENSLTDLWSQFSFACPVLLGSEQIFTRNFIEPEETKADLLKKIIKPYLLRRTKQDACPELPPLTREIVCCEMSSELNKRYEMEKSAARNRLLGVDKEKINSMQVLALLMRLRQLASDPAMLEDCQELESAKRDEIVARLQVLRQSGHKVLLFSSFVKQLNLLAAELDKAHIKYAMLTGETKDRQSVVSRFQTQPDLTCLLVSLKAGGTGLNLTAADYVFMLSPWWNPAAEQQAIDRAYRIGQTQPVMVYDFITKSTVEEKILQLQEKKRKLVNDYIENVNPLSSLTDDELMDLLS